MKSVARRVPLALLFALAVAPGAADAQRRRDDVPDRPQIEQRIRAQMGRMMQERLGLDEDRMPIVLRDCGNTVSSTIPIVIDQLRSLGRIVPERLNMLVGFGVGWSWAGCP